MYRKREATLIGVQKHELLSLYPTSESLTSLTGYRDAPSVHHDNSEDKRQTLLQ
ncbi:hypothetical protein CHS0354_004670, partial [Potamilus streckersoni]